MREFARPGSWGLGLGRARSLSTRIARLVQGALRSGGIYQKITADDNSGSRKERSNMHLSSNHTDYNRFALTFRVFRAGFLCKLFRFEGSRQKRELAGDVCEKQPLFRCFRHCKFIPRAGSVFQPVATTTCPGPVSAHVDEVKATTAVGHHTRGNQDCDSGEQISNKEAAEPSFTPRKSRR
jgi:hypothetical protein